MRFRIIMEGIEKVRLLGQGSMGKAYLFREKASG
jgi:hypothetical protein